MLFAIPTSQHDLKLLRPFVDVLKFLGGLHRHTFVFLPAPTVAGETATIAAELNGLCEKLAVDAVSREPEGKWPNACNMHFRDAVEQLDKRGELGKPWMWLELDTTPIRAGWADRLELEYNRQGKWALGVVRPVSDVLRDKDGKPTGEGDYMVGVGIYGANFKKVSCLYRHLVPGEPFDIHIRYELQKKEAGIHNTNLIESRGRTGNYRINADGKIECDEIEPMAGYASHAGVVGDLAFLVHGMKDSTLAELVLSGKRPIAQQERIIELESDSKPAISVSDEIASLRAENASLNAKLEAALAKLEQAKTISAPPNAAPGEPDAGSFSLSSPVETKVSADSPTVPSDAQPDPDPSLKELPPIEQIYKVVRSSGKKRRIADLAADLGVNQMRLRNLLKTPGNGLRIMQGGYVAIA